MLKLFVISDATGQTADRVVRAALAQFEQADVSLIRRRDIRSPDQIRAIVDEASQGDAIILHTLVSNQLRRIILEECRRRGVDSLDMLGPLLERLATRLNLSPSEKPGLFEQLLEAKSRQIEAVDFSFRHDDGRNVDDLHRAEVVLVGVSRSMKTPTMLYLAYQKWFAANVPLIPEIAIPEAVAALDPHRVFCLQMSASRLMELRRVRAKEEAIPIDVYASDAPIRKELEYARRACAQHGWRSIDVTGKSVEEVGREIIALLPKPSPPE